MKKPGTKPMAPELKDLRGVRRSRLTPIISIASAPEVMPKPPEYFDATARNKWHELYPVMQSCGVLKLSDMDTFAHYCFAYSQFRQAEKMLRKFPSMKVKGEEGEGFKYIFKTPNGAVQAVPYMSMVRQWLEVVHRLGAELGLTPSARNSISAYKKSDKFERAREFMENGGVG